MESWIRLQSAARLGGSSGFATTTAQNGEEKATYFAGRVIISLESGKRVVVAARRGVAAARTTSSDLISSFISICRRCASADCDSAFQREPAFDQWAVNNTISPSTIDSSSDVELDRPILFNSCTDAAAATRFDFCERRLSRTFAADRKLYETYDDVGLTRLLLLLMFYLQSCVVIRESFRC